MNISSVLRGPAVRPVKKALARASTPAIRRRSTKRCTRTTAHAANHEQNIFLAARRRLAGQVMDARTPDEITRAVTLNAAIRKYLTLEEGLEMQTVAPARVGAALDTMLAVAEQHIEQVSPGALKGDSRGARPSDAVHLWHALVLAGRLRRSEIDQLKSRVLPPRLPGPYTPAAEWNALWRRLEDMRHGAWPQDVRVWFEALIPAVEAYVAAEQLLAGFEPTLCAVENLSAKLRDVADKFEPPAATDSPDVPMRLRLNWSAESEKKVCIDNLEICRSAMALRNAELRELIELLRP